MRVSWLSKYRYLEDLKAYNSEVGIFFRVNSKYYIYKNQ